MTFSDLFSRIQWKSVILLSIPLFMISGAHYFHGYDLMTLSFQSAATNSMHGIIAFHEDLMIILSFILGVVLYMLFVTIYIFNQNKTDAEGTTTPLNHAPLLELVWTIVPALILLVIATPSFALLYSIDEHHDAFIVVKVIGHQWYWTYHIYDFNPTNWLSGSDALLDYTLTSFDSYMVDPDTTQLAENLGSQLKNVLPKISKEKLIETYTTFANRFYKEHVLLVDTALMLPVRINVKANITSADVLHCWAVPSLGIKLDACPGRINETNIHILHSGTYKGQCSEICGVNHGFMPIGIGTFYPNENMKKISELHAFLLFNTDNSDE